VGTLFVQTTRSLYKKANSGNISNTSNNKNNRDEATKSYKLCLKNNYKSAVERRHKENIKKYKLYSR